MIRRLATLGALVALAAACGEAEHGAFDRQEALYVVGYARMYGMVPR